jgi:hypothetical protein
VGDDNVSRILSEGWLFHLTHLGGGGHDNSVFHKREVLDGHVLQGFTALGRNPNL